MSLRASARGAARGLPGGASGSALCCISVVALGVGTMQAFGGLSDVGLLLVVAALALALVALKAGLRTPTRTWWAVTTVIVALTNLLYPRLGGPFAGHAGVQTLLTLSLAATAGGACVLRPGRAAMALLGAASVSLLALMAVTWTWGFDNIDVFTGINRATDALLHGGNPYGPVFISRIAQYPWYSAGHLPYGPIVPILAALGWLVGDVRVMSVVALAVTFVGLWLLARQGGHRLDAHRVVALAIASPFNVGMVNRSWVEIYIVAGVVMWLALRGSRRRLAILCLGVAMLVNAITPLVLLPAFIWSRRARREVVVAAIGAALFALPFALITGVGQFLHDVIGVQLTMSPWYGSLDVIAFAWQSWHLALPSALTAMVALIALVAIAWRGRPEHLGDIAVQAALLVLATFLFAKFAFFNQYYIAAAMLVTGLAGVGVAFPAGDVSLPDVHALRRPIRRRGTPDPLTSPDDKRADAPADTPAGAAVLR